MTVDFSKLKKPVASVQDVLDRVLDDVVSHFNAECEPMQLRVLSQRYSSRAKRFGFELLSGIEADERLGICIGEKGSRLVYPKAEFNEMFPGNHSTVLKAWAKVGLRNPSLKRD